MKITDYLKIVKSIPVHDRCPGVSDNELNEMLSSLIKHDNKQEISTNDVVCPISSDCSLNGCYRYFICDFHEKKKEQNINGTSRN